MRYLRESSCVAHASGGAGVMRRARERASVCLVYAFLEDLVVDLGQL